MASSIDVYACIVSSSAGVLDGVGNAYSPQVTYTGAGIGDRGTVALIAATARTIYDALGTTDRFTAMYVCPSVAGTLSMLCADSGGNTRLWRHVRIAAKFPFMVAGDAAITNADPAADAGDDGNGNPTGLADAGKLDGQVWKVIFTPDAAGTLTWAWFS